MKRITVIIIISVIVILIGWDIYVASNRIAGDTISEIIYQTAVGNPIISFAFGVLMGHFFWPQKKVE